MFKVVDGMHHIVDSSEYAFQLAAEGAVADVSNTVGKSLSHNPPESLGEPAAKYLNTLNIVHDQPQSNNVKWIRTVCGPRHKRN